MSNYPLGAKYDSLAPYNQTIKTVSVCVSFTCYQNIEIEVEGPYNEDTLKEIVDELTYEERQQLWNKGWEEDEFTVIEN